MRAEGVFEVANKRGLHARAASKLVQLASSFSCNIEVSRDGQAANAKSVMGVLLLCGSMGSRLRFVADGADAQQAIETIGKLIESKFGEGE